MIDRERSMVVWFTEARKPHRSGHILANSLREAPP